MLNTYKQELESISHSFTKKQFKKMKINSLCNLSLKLRDFEDENLEGLMIKIKELINSSIEDEEFDQKNYKKKVIEVKQIVNSKFDLQERGSVSSQYLGIGITLGAGIGIVFTSINPGMMSIFSAFGLAVGVYIGNQKESSLDKKGKIY